MLSKTTQNYAIRRGYEALDMSISGRDEFDEIPAVWVFEDDDEVEPAVIYRSNDDGGFTFYGTSWLDDAIKEELPATLRDEKHLREMINYLASERKAA